MNNIISVDNLSKSYGDKQVVKGISFNVSECEIFGF
ncbi:MAG: ABC transporter ATP-binding protein, partial [Candidatus Riflebacteria bacterium]|nr:ABC transporter ATP-binding protein [Candidatus Riflebacteria bacterium]